MDSRTRRPRHTGLELAFLKPNSEGPGERGELLLPLLVVRSGFGRGADTPNQHVECANINI